VIEGAPVGAFFITSILKAGETGNHGGTEIICFGVHGERREKKRSQRRMEEREEGREKSASFELRASAIADLPPRSPLFSVSSVVEKRN
jgi:hypothetical protein